MNEHIEAVGKMQDFIDEHLNEAIDIVDIAKACADTGTFIEINDKHKHLTADEIRMASAFDVKLIIGSDAHIPSKVGSFKGPLARALEAGLDPERIVNIKEK